MNVLQIIKNLQAQYPRKTIIKNNEHNPTEIICEIRPMKAHPEYSVAIAFIDASLPHYHKKTFETYEILEGELLLVVSGIEHRLKRGETFLIHPLSVHSAKGNETKVKVTSKPGWTVEDHILV